MHKLKKPDILRLANLTAAGKTIDETSEALGISRITFFRRLRDNPDFATAYADGKSILADCQAQQALTMAMAEIPSDIDPKLANAHIQQRRLVVDTLKWTAGKLKPKSWGDRVEVDHGGTVTVSPLAQLRQIGANVSSQPVIDVETVDDDGEEDCF